MFDDVLTDEELAIAAALRDREIGAAERLAALSPESRARVLAWLSEGDRTSQVTHGDGSDPDGREDEGPQPDEEEGDDPTERGSERRGRSWRWVLVPVIAVVVLVGLGALILSDEVIGAASDRIDELIGRDRGDDQQDAPGEEAPSRTVVRRVETEPSSDADSTVVDGEADSDVTTTTESAAVTASPSTTAATPATTTATTAGPTTTAPTTTTVPPTTSTSTPAPSDPQAALEQALASAEAWRAAAIRRLARTGDQGSVEGKISEYRDIAQRITALVRELAVPLDADSEAALQTLEVYLGMGGDLYVRDNLQLGLGSGSSAWRDGYGSSAELREMVFYMDLAAYLLALGAEAAVSQADDPLDVADVIAWSRMVAEFVAYDDPLPESEQRRFNCVGCRIGNWQHDGSDRPWTLHAWTTKSVHAATQAWVALGDDGDGTEATVAVTTTTTTVPVSADPGQAALERALTSAEAWRAANKALLEQAGAQEQGRVDAKIAAYGDIARSITALMRELPVPSDQDHEAALRTLEVHLQMGGDPYIRTQLRVEHIFYRTGNTNEWSGPYGRSAELLEMVFYMDMAAYLLARAAEAAVLQADTPEDAAALVAWSRVVAEFVAFDDPLPRSEDRRFGCVNCVIGNWQYTDDDPYWSWALHAWTNERVHTATQTWITLGQDPGGISPTTTTTLPFAEAVDGKYISVIRSLNSSENAESQKADLERRHRGREFGILLSTDFASLRPGYWVVYAGPFDTPDEAQTTCWSLGLRRSSQCYGRKLSQDEADRSLSWGPRSG